ncbi:MAG TPA: alpha/beta family hydrolase [Vicinamibacterales bacterium]|jgi:predicted alpha/beta-hydrolase family hydrolase|nr:alpha/beta family hydrolase [Vicinamibacterales bacterium]
MTSPGDSWKVAVGQHETTAIWEPPLDAGGASDPLSAPCFVCAHGAGGHLSDRLTLAATRALREIGLSTVRFNFLYRERKSSRPDPMPQLIACLDAVIERVQRERNPPRLILGGRSMGGRAASMLLAGRTVANGLLLLAYPLHPPGQPAKLRADHLAAIQVPVLCFNGTRDPFCDPPLMNKIVAALGANWRMHWLDGADHSFHVLKSSGRSDSDVLAEVAAETSRWIATVV